MDDALGEIDAAIAQLEKGVDRHNVHALFLQSERYSRLRSEPRFQALVARVGLA